MVGREVKMAVNSGIRALSSFIHKLQQAANNVKGPVAIRPDLDVDNFNIGINSRPGERDIAANAFISGYGYCGSLTKRIQK